MSTGSAALDLIPAFDCEKYLSVQLAEILRRMEQTPQGGITYVEFGGKAYDDQHAARVLPGYDPHLKLRLLGELKQHFEIVVVVSARDILRPRLRGDTSLWYDDETVRLITCLSQVGIHVHHGVLTMVRKNTSVQDRKRLDRFLAKSLSELEIQFVEHGFIQGYPSIELLDQANPFADSPRLPTSGRPMLMVSPGGGSGKFSVILTQLWYDFAMGLNSAFVKFETFPAFALPPEHPVNLAFVAATADLGNTVMPAYEDGPTTYDKDVENFRLLRTLMMRSCPNLFTNPMSGFRYPPEMGVNRLHVGIVNDAIIRRAAIEEIHRRAQRYRREIANGIEIEKTLEHLTQALPDYLRHLVE